MNIIIALLILGSSVTGVLLIFLVHQNFWNEFRDALPDMHYTRFE
jgi:hypothetical protein